MLLLIELLVPLCCLLLGATLLELKIKPGVPSWQARPLSSWWVHLGCVTLFYCLYLLVSQRPWFAASGVLALYFILLMVNNVKFDSLKEPFVHQDFEYFTDAIRHPRLYLPFFGVARTLLGVLVSLLVVGAAIWVEPSLSASFQLLHWLGVVGVLLIVALVMTLYACRYLPEMRVRPAEDLARIGFLPMLCAYIRLACRPMKIDRPTRLEQAAQPLLQSGSSPGAEKKSLPDLIVVQSESFFDPRVAYPFIRSDVLANFDQACLASVQYGELTVPAWGANTVRTECAFLTGLTEQELGIHRFNPYRQLLKQPDLPNLAGLLKQAGYQTICIHPYPQSFYQRDQVFKHLGFDQFIDIRNFEADEYCGQYIGDQAVMDRVEALMSEPAAQPRFIFVITMENHGPLHLEKPLPGSKGLFYQTEAPPECEDLTVYLQHLKNADNMIARLTALQKASFRPCVVGWYGDHVPIMPDLYGRYGEPNGGTCYYINTAHSEGFKQTIKPIDMSAFTTELLRYVVCE
ncbi:LTA synthase family protein [Nitrincola sp. MINF-07-Sa-05]|uniref:LTA synthase family protein n=1 Tax=Nitrincola salilacus TaxID=3400273 RepID=UPI0039181458